MPDKVLRWGLLSTANINRAVIGPLQESARNELHAVASRRPDAAEAYARQWEIPRAYGSYEALLADPEIDVIYNPLPNSLHAEWTIKAAQAGKHVLLEKPLAMSVAEVDAVIAAAQAAGVVVTEAFMYRHHPQTLKVKEMLDGGVVGDLALIRGTFSFEIKSADDIRLNPNLGGGSIWDVGCYPISYARYAAGREPLEVFGRQVVGDSGVDEFFAGQLAFSNDLVAQINCGFRLPLRASMEFVGSRGTLHVPMPFKPDFGEHLVLVREDETEVIPMPGRSLYQGEVEDLADAVLDGRPPRISLQSSRANVAAIVALLESAQSGRPVRLAQG